MAQNSKITLCAFFDHVSCKFTVHIGYCGTQTPNLDQINNLHPVCMFLRCDQTLVNGMFDYAA